MRVSLAILPALQLVGLATATLQRPANTSAVSTSRLFGRDGGRNEDENGALLCDKDTPCSDGSCCGTIGKCGYGPDFCGSGNCTSNCDALAMCGPYGDLTYNDGKCGMGLCCGYYGWCGTGESHCTGTTDAPCRSDYGPCAIATPKKCGTGSGTTSGRTIGYYQGSNTYSRACNRIKPSDIDTSKYTHLYYAFASIDPTTFKVQPADSRDIAVYSEFTALKSQGVKTWIAVGGFDFSDPNTTTHYTWSQLVSSSFNRAAFISSLLDFLPQYGFEGVDIDWEYPVDETRGGSKADTANLVLLVQEMRAAFGSNYGISMALAPDLWYLRYFDAIAMQPYLDWFGFMTYDLHGFWDGENANIGSIVRGQAGIDEIQNNTAPLWFDGLDFSKINFGLAYYGRGYTLADPINCNGLGCTFSGPNNAAQCSATKGVMSLTEIEELIESKGLTPTLLEAQMMKSIQWADQWIGYDDDETFAMKKSWASDYCFGGTMAWSVDYYSGAGSGNNLPLSTDGTCGFDAQMRCGNDFGACCSGSGWCGDDDGHCGSGCQSTYGNCTTGGTTTDNTCGVAHNDQVCGDSSEGPCCSMSGYCGWGESWCGIGNCQSGCSTWPNKGVDGNYTGPINENSTCNDIKGTNAETSLSKDLFVEIEAGPYFSGWLFENTGGKHWLPAFAKPLGMEQSLGTCGVPNDCDRPDCADIDDGTGAGWKYMILVSAVNLNQYFANLYKAVEQAGSMFSLHGVALTQDLFRSAEDNVFLDTLALNGLAAGITAAASLGNPALAASGAILAGIVYELIAVIQNKDKVEFQDQKRIFDTIALAFVDSVATALNDANNNLVEGTGVWEHKDPDMATTVIDAVLYDGDWVNYEEIPMVSADYEDTITAGTDMFYNLIGANIVNWSWRQSQVYISCYPMDEDTFTSTKVSAGDNNDQMKIYYQGMGCYFQSAYPEKGWLVVHNPVGWDKLQDNNFTFTTHDIMKSSIDSYLNYGFDVDRSKDSSYYDEFATSGKDIASMFSTAGLFSIPLCIPNTDKSTLKNFFADLEPPLKDGYYQPWCFCLHQKDKNGKTLDDVYNFNADGWETKVCSG